MAKNFMILFEEKEGSTPLVRTLDQSQAIDVLHIDEGQGWEPFDQHVCGPIPRRDFARCLDLIYGPTADPLAELQAVYSPRARGPLVPFDKRRSIGFKMRLRAHRPGGNRWTRALNQRAFERTVYRALRKHGVATFVTVRQDVLRWALSRYHGDGTGKPGHLQFKLSEDRIKREDIDPIHVDLERFREIVSDCEAMLNAKRQRLDHLRGFGIEAHPLLYEQFCDDKPTYFSNLLGLLHLPNDPKTVEALLAQDSGMKKVHGHDIHEFVTNADEVVAEFGDRFANWI